MNKIDIGKSGLLASEISLGCMRIGSMSPAEADTLINTALEVGIDFFDHADIYGGGKSEEVFAGAFADSASIANRSSCNPSAASARACSTFHATTSSPRSTAA